jgi:hypothetical protein
MSDTTSIELKNHDTEEVYYILEKIEKSFGFKFDKKELEHVTTFGELCDIITNKVQGDSINDCTTQQAFYMLRKALSTTLLVDNDLIKTETSLFELFPKQNRKQRIKKFETELGFPTDILDIKQWMGWTIVIGFVGSLIMFFFNWKIALSGLTFSILFSWVTIKFFSTELEALTVGQLAEKVSRENYKKARRNPATINKKEIAQKVKELFIKDFDLNESVLTREATFV